MSRDKAKELLVHWFFTVAPPSTEGAVASATDEIASIVDEIVDAAVSEVMDRIEEQEHRRCPDEFEVAHLDGKGGAPATRTGTTRGSSHDRARHHEGRLASVSGGKDSAAMSLYLRELGIEHDRVFMDTGWEHPATYDYLRGERDRADHRNPWAARHGVHRSQERHVPVQAASLVYRPAQGGADQGVPRTP